MGITGRKKALLIGVLYRNFSPESQLPGAARDVEQLKDLLIECYDYAPEDIVVMTDQEGALPEMKPTQLNVMREMRLLLNDAGDHDHFLFHFAGHSDQIPSHSDTEDDQQDEIIVCEDNTEIQDNILRQMLVDRLPKGASLTAIFDSCHSGTLLDLEHDQCNKVWVPWVNKGERNSSALRNWNVRKNALCQTGGVTRCPKPEEAQCFIDSDMPMFDENMQYISPRRVPTLASSKRSSLVTFPERRRGWTVTPGVTRPWLLSSRRSSSPTPVRDRCCNGACRDRVLTQEEEHPLVVSISAAKDDQTSWTDCEDTVTLTLVKILRENPRITHYDLLSKLNYSLHGFTRELHRVARSERRDYLEMNNFQEPQLGSLTPLNMNDEFIL